MQNDKVIDVVGVVFLAILVFIMIGQFLTCIWSDSDRTQAPLKHPINHHIKGGYYGVSDKI